MEIHIDFETRSHCDLRKQGAWVYSRHETTEIICLSYALGDGPIGIAHPAFPDIPAKNWPPTDLWVAVQNRDNTIHAHNAFFETAIWENVCLKLGWPKVSPQQWRCTLAIAAYHALPRGLDGASKALGLPFEKDMAGNRIMLKCSKPNKDGEWHEKKEDLEKTFRYCMQDVEVERALEKRLTPLPPQELKVWQLDQIINRRGIMFDRKLAETAVEVAEKEKAKANIELFELTDGVVKTATERKAFDNWTALEGYNMTKKSLAKECIPEYLKDLKIPETIREAIKIRASVSAASVNKYKAMIRLMDTDDRIRDGLRYYGASTGRWAGKGVQIQNFPRGYGDTMTDVCESIISEEFDYIKAFYKDDPMNALKKATRGAIITKQGHEMFVADYSSVEARGLMWLIDDKAAIKVFNEADIYCDMASGIYGYEVNKKDHPFARQLGKQAILGCFGKNTLVYTDNGVKQIIDVTLEDKLWDGDNWVSHEGLIDQGVKETRNMSGVWVTEDHEIFIDEDTCRYAHMINRNGKHNTSLLNLAIKFGGNAWRSMHEEKKTESHRTEHVKEFKIRFNMKVLPPWRVAVMSQRTYDIANAGPNHRFMIMTKDGPMIVHNCGYGMGYIKFFATLTTYNITLSNDLVRNMVPEEDLEYYKKQVIADAPQIAKSDISLKENIGALVGCKYIVNKYRDKYALVKKFWGDIEAAALSAMHDPGLEVPVAKLKWKYLPEYGFLQCELPSGRHLNYPQPMIEPTMMATFTATNKTGKQIKIKFNKIHKITDEPIKAKRLAEAKSFILDSSVPNIWESEKLTYLKAEFGKTKRTPTYGGKLVENCFSKDTEVLTKEGWKPISGITKDDWIWDGEEYVKSLGAKYMGVKETIHWFGVNVTPEHKIKTFTGWRPIGEIHMGSEALECLQVGHDALPWVSGYPWFSEEIRIDHTKINMLVYDIINCGPRHRYLVKTKLGPVVAHNCVQAICRDLMAEAMIKAEKKGYPIIMTVHDEVCAEVKSGTKKLQDFEEILCENPDWASGFPIGAEGFICKRYRK